MCDSHHGLSLFPGWGLDSIKKETKKNYYADFQLPGVGGRTPNPYTVHGSTIFK